MICKNRNSFCYICGLFIDKRHRLKFENNKALVAVYNEIFYRAYVSSKWYEPEYICVTCSSKLKLSKSKKNNNHIQFSSPMIWQNQTYHKEEDCYFCQTNVTGRHYKMRHNIQYADVLTVTKPVQVAVDNPLTMLESEQLSCDEDLQSVNELECEDNDTEFVPSASNSPKCHLITNADYKDIVRDFKFSRRQSEGLASRLKQWKVVDKDFKITSSRNDLERMFFNLIFEEDKNQSLVYCTDVNELFIALDHTYVPHEWRLFIDGSCRSKNSLI